MTVGQKMHTTLSNLESACASLKSFALETQDQSAKQMFNDYAAQLDNMIQSFKGRVDYIEQQEPQYKVRQQAGQQQQMKK
ncbi:MAG: DUF1657 domain-containing protein [Firmicutes bacterium]|nr:DUF1657 domain-containing protein [Bacillota bacterium]